MQGMNAMVFVLHIKNGNEVEKWHLQFGDFAMPTF